MEITEKGEMPEHGTAVAVDANHLGRRFAEPGQSFNLDALFSPLAMMNGADKYTRVYFRTDSGNIYQLNDRGELLNGNECKRKGVFEKMQLDKRATEQLRLTVGAEFDYTSGHTTPVTEIVAASDRHYHPDYLKTLTGDKHTTIREDLLTGLPTPPQDSADAMARLELRAGK